MRIGIDPGITGSVAFSFSGYFELYSMPIVAVGKKEKNEVDPERLHGIIGRYVAYHNIESVNLESVSAMPGQGVTSMFNFGQSFGIVKGVLGSLGLKYNLVRPADWKRPLGLIGTEKDAARLLAISRYPKLAGELELKKDGGKADALWICLHGKN